MNAAELKALGAHARKEAENGNDVAYNLGVMDLAESLSGQHTTVALHELITDSRGGVS